MASNKHQEQHNHATTAGEKDALREELLEEIDPKRAWLNHFCKALNYFTVFVALFVGVLLVCAFFYVNMTILENLLCFYNILFCLLAIITETDFLGLTRGSKILNLWAFRGLFYVFIGIVGLDTIDTGVVVNGAKVQRFIYKNLLVISSCVMIGIGVLYIAMGLLCVQVLNNKLEHDYQERRAKAKEIRHTTDKYGALSETPEAKNVV